MSAKIYSIVLILVFFLTTAATVLLRKGSADPQSSSQPLQTTSPDQLDVPVADFNAPQPTDPGERIKREIKSKRHNLRDKSLTPEDKAQFVLREDNNSPASSVATSKKTNATQQPKLRGKKSDYSSPVIAGAVTDNSLPEQALPTQMAALVKTKTIIPATVLYPATERVISSF